MSVQSCQVELSLLNFLSLFRDLQKPTRFGGGGGSRIFPCSPEADQVPPVIDQSNPLNSGTFVYNSVIPGDHAPFLETHGNSGRLGRSECDCDSEKVSDSE